MSRVHLLCQALPKLEIPLPPADKFTLFPKLPLELRHRIWRLTSMVPRTIHLKMRNLVSMDIYDDQPEAPAVLHTSRESRREGMRYYNLCRELKSVAAPRSLNPTWDRFNYGRRNVVWINFNVDRFSYRPGLLMFLSIDGDETVHREKSFNFEGAVMQRIRNLVTYIDGRDYVIAMDLLRRLGRVFGR